jgi:hypothetical protein
MFWFSPSILHLFFHSHSLFTSSSLTLFFFFHFFSSLFGRLNLFVRVVSHLLVKFPLRSYTEPVRNSWWWLKIILTFWEKKQDRERERERERVDLLRVCEVRRRFLSSTSLIDYYTRVVNTTTTTTTTHTPMRLPAERRRRFTWVDLTVGFHLIYDGVVLDHVAPCQHTHRAHRKRHGPTGSNKRQPVTMCLYNNNEKQPKQTIYCTPQLSSSIAPLQNKTWKWSKKIQNRGGICP